MNAQTDVLKDAIQGLKDEVKALVTEVHEADSKRLSAIEELKKADETVREEIERKLAGISDEMSKKLAELDDVKGALEELQKRMDRPEFSGSAADMSDAERKDAIEFYRMVHKSKAGNVVEALDFDESTVDVAAYKHYRSAFEKLLHVPYVDDLKKSLTPDEQKALNLFSASGGTYFVSPQMSRTVLSCLDEQTDVMSLMGRQNISRSALKIPVDNSWDEAGWACETNCFANNPSGKLLDGLGEKTITADELRYVACATRGFLEDPEVDTEMWLGNKIRDAFVRAISRAIMEGDGNGRPMGILNQNSGIGSITAKPAPGGAPAGEFTWQDLYALKYAIPTQYHGPGFAFITSPEGLSYILTMTGADGHPIIRMNPQTGGPTFIDGSPIRINTYMPKPTSSGAWATGSVPVSAGNWQRAYLVVVRRGLTLQRDDYSAGFCVLFKAEMRIGGDVLCANAAKHLRVN